MKCQETVTKSFVGRAESENDKSPKKVSVLKNEAVTTPLHSLFFFLAFFAFTSVSAQNEFITTWFANGNTITIPTEGGGYNYNIYWEEIDNETNNGSATGIAGDYTISLPNTNRYRIKISGDFPRIFFSKLSWEGRVKIVTVEQWGNISWSSMQAAFQGCASLTIPATDAPDLSRVTSLKDMFKGALTINQDIAHWDVSNVTNMEGMFYGANSFNQDISAWDVSNVTNMSYMFYSSLGFNQDISNWDVSNVTNMAYMFTYAYYFNGDIGNWNVSNVADMSFMFAAATSFNQNIGNWDVSNVTTMQQMFQLATFFNQDIGNWNVGNVTNMGGMFRDAPSFNQDIGTWNVSKVTDMTTLFLNATAFNRNLGAWDVTQVSDMTDMLSNSGLTSENYHLTLAGWAAKNVKTNVPLGAHELGYCANDAGRNTLLSKSWTISGDISADCSFITTWQATDGTITIPTTGGGYNYNIYWEEIDNVSNNGNATATGNYTINTSNANKYRVKITGQFPRIYFNDGADKNKILTVEQWGNIAWTDMSGAFFGCSNLTVPAADAPDLSGVTSLVNMFRNATSLTVDHIDLWDVSHVQSMDRMFASCHSFNGHIGGWDVSNATGLSWMFYDARIFNQDIGNWNVGNATNIGVMFWNASSFNQDIGNWNVGNVTNMGGMFWNATAFDKDIGNWDVSKVLDMNLMFQDATSFNQNLGNWDITQVSNMANMLNNSGLSSENYHLTLAGWALKNVKTNVPLGAQGLEYGANDAGRKTLLSKSWTISGDLCAACSFITTWQTTDGTINIPTTGTGYNYNIYWEEIGDEAGNNGSVTGVKGYRVINGLNAGQYRVKITGLFPRIFFNDAVGKNKILTVEQWGDITWTDMSGAFFGCSNLTVPAADAPDLSGVRSLVNMFRNATSLTVDHIDLWDVSHVTNMYRMFWNATAFNQNIGNWDVSKVTDMGSMFQNATSFNQDISNWDVGNVTRMDGMFWGATAFNQNIGNWDVSKVTDMGSMFQDATAFNQNIGNWNVSNVTNMTSMFQAATSFNQGIGNWDVSNVRSMAYMFWDATVFNQDISNWDVGNVRNMSDMFRNATAFNQDIGNWDVGNVTNMGVMFWNATVFNQDIGNWDVGNVTNMGGMFWDATAFNHDISNWDVSKVTDMNLMFLDATSFNQNLGNWNVIKVSNMANMLNNSGLSRENYELTLEGWASKNVLNGLTLGASGLQYCSETARNTLISGKGWTITDDAKLCSQTITFNALPTHVYGDIFTLSATASSGLPVTYSSSDPSIASIAGNTVTVLGTGGITITATQDGDVNNEAANSEQPLFIGPKPVTITVDAGHTKIYGEADPALTYSVDPPLINGDNFTGSLARTTGENAGTYSINQNTLTAGSNYTITYVGDDFAINPRAVTVTANSGLTKIYGEADPFFTYSVDPPLINDDNFTGTLTRTAGENTGTYSINQNTLTAGNNYTTTFVGADFTITPKAITVTATSGQTKIYGETDPILTYAVNPALISGDVFTGALARAAGEIGGTYPINLGTLDAGSNYVIAFVGANFHILKLDQTITFDPFPDKSYGDDPFTIVATASSSLPISFTSSDESIAIISGDVVTLVGSGSVTITAIQEGNEIYNPQQVSQTLEVNPVDVFIPNFFSPDGNGVNDTFLVHGAGIDEIQLIVFDRLGKEVFSTTDVHIATQQGWDGKKRGEDQPAGTYSWVLKGKRQNGNPLSFQGKSYGQVVLMR